MFPGVYNVSGLGLVATHRRNIKSGREYDQYFPRSEGQNKILKQNATVYDTLDSIQDIVTGNLKDTERIAKILKKVTTQETCKSIFDFAYWHIQYDKDQEGIEQLRRPARAWSDRKSGIDCDCFSVFCSSILTNLKIPHYYRIIKRNYSPEFSHIYLIVPKKKNANLNNHTDYWVIDPVLDRFDKEADSITQKFDKMSTIPLELLNGLGNPGYYPALSEMPGHEFEHINGLMGDDVAINQMLNGFKKMLINTKNNLRTKPSNGLYHKAELEKAIQYAIKHWDNAHTRDKAMDFIASMEDKMIAVAQVNGLVGLHGLSGMDDPDVEEILNGIDGLGKGFLNKIKNAVKNSGQKIVQVAKKTNQKVAAVAKKVGKAVLKFNPLSVSIRVGFLLAAEINFAGISKRLMYGYMTKEQAAKKGVDADTWARSKSALDKVSKLFVNTLKGEPKALQKAILSGKRKDILNGLGNPAALAPAMAFIVKVGDILSKAFKGSKKVIDIIDKGKDMAQNAKEALDLQKFAQANPGAGSEFNENAPADSQASSGQASQSSGSQSQPSGSGSSQPFSQTSPSSNNAATDTTTPDPANSNDSPANNAANVTDTSTTAKKSGNGILIAVGVAAAIGIAAMSGKKEKKGFNGPEDIEKSEENLSGVKKAKAKVKSKAKAKKKPGKKQHKKISYKI